jgi:hypothetical protein
LSVTPTAEPDVPAPTPSAATPSASRAAARRPRLIGPSSSPGERFDCTRPGGGRSAVDGPAGALHTHCIDGHATVPAAEAEQLKATIQALRLELERVAADAAARLQDAERAHRAEVRELQETIRALRERLEQA